MRTIKMPPIKMDHLKDLIVDFEGVEYINSIGISHWIAWATDIKHSFRSARLVLRNCTVGITKQLTAVEGFMPLNSRVLSFEVPFYCHDCGQNRVTMYKEGDTYKFDTMSGEPVFKHPTVNCTRCRTPMEIDTSRGRCLKSYPGRKNPVI